MRRVKSRWSLAFIVDKCLDVAIKLNSSRLVSYVLGIEFKCPVCRHKTTIETLGIASFDDGGHWIECDWCQDDHSTDGSNYPTYNSRDTQWSNPFGWKWLTVFRTGSVEILCEYFFLALDLRVWLDTEVQFEEEKTFCLYFRVDKGITNHTSIVFVGIDPWEIWEQIGHGVRPKDRGGWLTFSIGKWDIVNI
jgi:hypothetical protein